MLFDKLPKAVQDQITEYLASNNFIAAKNLYDAWLSEFASQTPVQN